MKTNAAEKDPRMAGREIARMEHEYNRHLIPVYAQWKPPKKLNRVQISAFVLGYRECEEAILADRARDRKIWTLILGGWGHGPR